MNRATMTFSRTLLFSAMIGVLSGCVTLPSTSSSVNQASTLSGELTTRSPLNVNNGTRYQSFTLHLKAGDIIEVKQTNDLSSQLSLFDAQNRLVNGPGENSLTLTPQQTGNHTLTLSGASSSQYGPFNLQLTPVNVRNSGVITSGERVAGLLNNTNGNSYDFQVTQEAIYSITLTSDTLDTTLALSGNGINLENDDAGEGTNSRLDAYLKPGQYRLLSNTLTENPNGTYVLGIDQRAVPTGVTLTNSGTLQKGKTITGLASSAPAQYTLQLSQPAMVQLTMSSNDVDSHLSITGNNVDASDDDGAGNNYDARLTQLLEAGTYQVAATSVNSQAGVFTLEYTTIPVTRGNLQQLLPGQYATGNLNSARPVNGMLRISEAGTYQIDLSASDFDAVLRVEGTDVDVEDDDSGGSRNARVTLELEPGDYRLQARGIDNSSRGRFTVSVQKQ